jgi:hypothetical protein
LKAGGRALGLPSSTPPSTARFFIVGAGRSGTTLLRLILCGHSRLHVAPETWFIADLLAELPACGALDAAQCARAGEIMVGHYRWPDLGIDRDEMRAEIAALRTPDLRAIIDLGYARLGRAAGKPRVGDKTPVYVRCLTELAALYPEAKFIHLLRDGRDVAQSYIGAGWPQRCYEGSAFEWTQAVRSARAFALPARMLEVRYEALAAEPEAQTRRICGFLGEAFEPGMLDVADRVDLVPVRERSIHGGLGRGVNAEAAGAWRRRSGAAQNFVMEACLARELRANGYALRFGGARWRAPLVTLRFVFMAGGPLLMRFVPAMQRRGYLRGF